MGFLLPFLAGFAAGNALSSGGVDHAARIAQWDALGRDLEKIRRDMAYRDSPEFRKKRAKEEAERQAKHERTIAEIERRTAEVWAMIEANEKARAGQARGGAVR